MLIVNGPVAQTQRAGTRLSLNPISIALRARNALENKGQWGERRSGARQRSGAVGGSQHRDPGFPPRAPAGSTPQPENREYAFAYIATKREGVHSRSGTMAGSLRSGERRMQKMSMCAPRSRPMALAAARAVRTAFPNIAPSVVVAPPGGCRTSTAVIAGTI